MEGNRPHALCRQYNRRNSRESWVPRTACALVSLCLTLSPARAAVSGHTDLGFGGFGSWSGTNNYAVLDLLDVGDAAIYASITAAGTFSPGTGSGPAPATRYIYLYQPTNDAVSVVPLVHFTNSLGLPGNSAPLSPNFWGQYTGVVLTDAGGPISPANDLDALTGAVGAAGLNPAVEIFLASPGIPSSFVSRWVTGPLGGSALEAGETSTLFVFGSPFPPGTFPGSLQNGGAGVTGPSVAPLPEPATLGLLALGFATLLRSRSKR
jgi:hypothetical protein